MLRTNEIIQIVKDAREDAARTTTANTGAYAKIVCEYVSGHTHTNTQFHAVMMHVRKTQK